MNRNIGRGAVLFLAVAVISVSLFAAADDGHKCGQVKAGIEFLNPAANSAAPYSEAVKIGNVLILSGQLGLVPGAGKLAEGGIEAETRQALENIKAVLEKNGSSLARVFKSTVVMADMGEFAKMNSVYVSYFVKDRPARTAFAAAALAKGARVEIECWALID